MSKLQKYSTYNTLNILSPESKAENIHHKENNNNININVRKKKAINNVSSKEEQNKVKTPKEILSLLLKNTLGKSLFKLEKRTKEQSSTLKEIGKYYIFFEKQILSMKNGVDKKRKEEEKRQKMARKLKINSTPSHLRSRTVQTLRKNNINQDRHTIINTPSNIKNISKVNSIFRKKPSGNLNLEDTPKIRSRTVKSSRYNTNNNNIARIKNTKEIINTPKRIKNEDKEKLSRTLQRKDSVKLSKIRKNTLHKNREEDKGNERVGRKSIHKIIKKNNSKKIIKTEEENNKNKINITTNINTIKKSDLNSSNKTEEKSVYDFSKDKAKIKNDLELHPNESIKNLNINEILNNKKEEDEKENKKIKKNHLKTH